MLREYQGSTQAMLREYQGSTKGIHMTGLLHYMLRSVAIVYSRGSIANHDDLIFPEV